jgi:GNAT superfamily N-acetyltransferase
MTSFTRALSDVVVDLEPWPGEEIDPLFATNYREVNQWQDLAHPRLDHAAYTRASGDRRLVCVIARTVAGKIVGYCTAFVRPHLRNFGLVASWKDMLFVVPEWRGTGMADVLLDKCIEECRRRGAQLMFAQDKIVTNNMRRLLMERGFKDYQVQYFKVLK